MYKNDQHLISIVIIEYFSIDEIIQCIASIKTSCKQINYEIIVSSNSCYEPEKQDALKKEHTTVNWVFNEKNGGFAYGMNQGLRKAKGDFLIIMNPDVKIKSGLHEMIDFIDQHEEIGAIAPQIVNNQGTIQDSFRNYVSLPSIVRRTIKRLLSRRKKELPLDYADNKIQTVDWVIGAFIMVRKKTFQITNGLDESYFMYAEDLDWCTRIRNCGLEIVYYPPMQILYEGSRSARKSFKYTKIFLNSHLHYWHKFGFFGGYPPRRELQF